MVDQVAVLAEIHLGWDDVVRLARALDVELQVDALRGLDFYDQHVGLHLRERALEDHGQLDLAGAGLFADADGTCFAAGEACPLAEVDTPS